MSGERRSTCPVCSGIGSTTESRPVTVITAVSTPDAAVVPCARCEGTGEVLGVPSTVDELLAYDREPLTVRDEILALAAEKKGHREQELASWRDAYWFTDSHGERQYTQRRYAALLTVDGGLTISLTTTVDEDLADGRRVASTTTTAAVELASFEDIIRPFDFELYAHYGTGVPSQEDVTFPNESRLTRFLDAADGTVRVTRTHDKGHGLLSALRAIDLDALARAADEEERRAVEEAPQRRERAIAAARRAIPAPTVAPRPRWKEWLGFAYGISFVLAIPEYVLFAWLAMSSGSYEAGSFWAGTIAFWVVQPILLSGVFHLVSLRRANAVAEKQRAEHEAKIADYVKSHP